METSVSCVSFLPFFRDALTLPFEGNISFSSRLKWIYLDVYVFMQFGMLLMWLWCGIQFFKENDTAKGERVSWGKRWNIWTQFTRMNLIRIQVHLTWNIFLMLCWLLHYSQDQRNLQVEALGIHKSSCVVVETSVWVNF